MNMRIDPVCGMAVDPATAAVKFDYEGETYYFCHPICLRKFSAAPRGSTRRQVRIAARYGDGAAANRDAHCSRGRRIYLPDGPGCRADRPRRMSEMRDGA